MTATERIELESLTESLKDFWLWLAVALALDVAGLFADILTDIHIWVDYCLLFALSLAISAALARRGLVREFARSGLSTDAPPQSESVTAQTRPPRHKRRDATNDRSRSCAALGLGAGWLYLFAFRVHKLLETREWSLLVMAGIFGALFTVAAGYYGRQVLASMSARRFVRERFGMDTVAEATALGCRFDWLRGWRRTGD